MLRIPFFFGFFGFLGFLSFVYIVFLSFFWFSLVMVFGFWVSLRFFSWVLGFFLWSGLQLYPGFGRLGLLAKLGNGALLTCRLAFKLRGCNLQIPFKAKGTRKVGQSTRLVPSEASGKVFFFFFLGGAFLSSFFLSRKRTNGA